METWQVGPTINAHQMNNSRAAKVTLLEPKNRNPNYKNPEA